MDHCLNGTDLQNRGKWRKCIKCLFLLSCKHNYIDVVHSIYLKPLHVSAVQISHQQVGHGYTRIHGANKDNFVILLY